jgi:hypothetical protein
MLLPVMAIIVIGVRLDNDAVTVDMAAPPCVDARARRNLGVRRHRLNGCGIAFCR